MVSTTLPVYFLVIGVALCAPETVQNDRDAHELQNPEHQRSSEELPVIDDHPGPLEKRSPHYDFGLGKRAYSYVSEYKRLPVYDFGLGKRSRPYSFGLGKRSVDSEQANEITNELDQANLADFLDQYDDESGYEVKRARPYSFGLGKRFADDESSEEKRARMYDFGLGKRLPLYNFGLGKRSKGYNFGLGKRLSKFNFGLGKRERDMHRFGFGLGKRSAEETPMEESETTDA